MPVLEHGDVRIRYDEYGTGFPVLLFAPGGQQSSVGFWDRTPWNPIEHLSPHYRVIAMDQRNAGGSTAPVRSSDGWHSYMEDHLALLDALGIEKFHLLGMCIGGPFIAQLAESVPDRIGAAVVLQTIGLDGNRDLFHGTFDAWAAGLSDQHPEADATDWKGFRGNLYDGPHILYSVADDVVPRITTPMLVFLGNDEPHPASASRFLAAQAPNARLVEQWKEPENRDGARAAIEAFLAEHTPAS